MNNIFNLISAKAFYVIIWLMMCVQSLAQSETSYQPLPFLEGNPIWVYKYERLERWYSGRFIDKNNRSFTYYFLGRKKEIGGKVYTMVGEITSRGEDKLTVNRWLPVREENGIVYAITDSLPGLIEYDYLENEIPYQQLGNECVLYNFNKKIGETIYPQNSELTVESYGTYQLMDGTVCRVLKTRGEDFYLYEKLGYLHDSPYGIMGPPYEFVDPTGGDVFATRLNEYFGDNKMLYKAPDAQEGLCVNDTCGTRDDAYAYACSYKADPRQEEVFSYIRQLQMASEDKPVTFTANQMATIILPTAPDASKGKYYRLDRCEEGQIIFEQELQPQARIPYIIVPSEDFCIDPSTLDLEGLTQDVVSIEGISFIGSYKSEELKEKEGWYIDIIDSTPDCGFAPLGETGKGAFIGALRAYLTVNWDDPYNQGGTKALGEKLEIVLRDYGTGVENVNLNLNHVVFDLGGRKVPNGKLPRGIYIEEGQKKAIR